MYKAVQGNIQNLTERTLTGLRADTEIYVDGMTAMGFHDMNSSFAALWAMILKNNPEAAADRSLRILEAC